MTPFLLLCELRGWPIGGGRMEVVDYEGGYNVELKRGHDDVVKEVRMEVCQYFSGHSVVQWFLSFPWETIGC